MTPEQLDLVERVFGVALVLGTSPMEPDEFLRRFPADDGRAVTRMVLEEAVSREDKGLLETGLRMTQVFQSGKEVAEPLRVALLAPWKGVPHHVASVLGEVGDEESVDLLYGTAGSDFAFSGYRDMARFSVEALARIGTPEAVRALERLALSDDQSIMRAMTRYFHGYRWVRAAFDDEFIVLYTAAARVNPLSRRTASFGRVSRRGSPPVFIGSCLRRRGGSMRAGSVRSRCGCAGMCSKEPWRSR